MIPGFRTIKLINGSNTRLKRTMQRAAASFQQFPNLDEAAARRILLLLRHGEQKTTFNLFSQLTGISLEDAEWSNERIGAFVALSLKDYQAAEPHFRELAASENDPDERMYYLCMREFCRLKKDGMDTDAVCTLLKTIYRKDAAERVREDTADLSAILVRKFSPLLCPDCQNCGRNGKSCMHKQATELNFKIAAQMKAENVSQQALLELLQSYD